MKKIMLNDRYGLTEAVLSGRKTQTRRIIPRGFFTCTHDILDNNTLVFEDMYGDWHDIRKSAYALKVGEVVAIAQAYNDFYNDECDPRIFPDGAGWTNKMFVRAALMPHHISINNVRVDRLQDISDEDCIKEGIYKDDSKTYFNGYAFQIVRDQCGNMLSKQWYATPREAYATLIDKISCKGTWESNPYVFVYDFELID